MSFLFDSSAILKAIKENTVETLLGNNTLELTRYELGNVLWKESTLQKRLTNDESKRLVRLVKQVLNIMQVLEVDCHEEAILDAAQRLKLTFYDASYVFYARERKLTAGRRLKKEMRKIKSFNWSALVRAAIEARIGLEHHATRSDLERVRKDAARADAIYKEIVREYGYVDFNSAETIRHWREARSAS